MVLLFSGILAIEWLAPTKKKDGADNYEKTAYLEQYGGDLGSTLMIFPDSLEGKTDIKFKSGLKTGLFDTDGYILLECTMDGFDSTYEYALLDEAGSRIMYKEE